MQESIVAHPVRQMMGQPRATFGTVVICSRCADHAGEFLFPMNAFGAIWDAKPIFYAKARMGGDLAPIEFVGSDVEATPSLCIGNEACYRHRAFRKWPQFFAFRDVFPIARFAAAHFLIGIELVESFKLFITIPTLRLVLYFLVLGTTLACLVTICSKTPAIGFGDEVATLIEKLNMIDLLNGTPRKSCLMLDQILKVGIGRNLGIAQDRFVPRPIGPSPHRVHSRQTAHITRNNPVRCE